MFLHTILYMIILQMTFLHVYHLKHVIQQSLRQILEQSSSCSDVPRDSPISDFSLHVLEHLPSSLGVVGSGSLAMPYSSYTHRGSALRVMVNRLARARDSATH